jgi:Ran GTPase-activating protein (RanGAP) involved in mRNA processing and transport
METWYLAGNCIDSASFSVLVDGLVKSTSVTNVWLKRNPLGPSSAKDLFRLITEATHLQTLDLDQTELGDAGVAELFEKLAQHDKQVPLRNIYLNAVGIGEKSAGAIGKFLSSPHCLLESIYAANNPMGSAGAAALAEGLKQNKSISRLGLTSIGVSDDGVIALCQALKGHSKLTMFDIGQSYATEDLGLR